MPEATTEENRIYLHTAKNQRIHVAASLVAHKTCRMKVKIDMLIFSDCFLAQVGARASGIAAAMGACDS